MNTDDKTTYAQFINGELVAVDRPDWYAPVAEADDNASPLHELGYLPLGTFGDTETDAIEVFGKTHDQPRSYVVAYWGNSTLTTVIFIEGDIEYLKFRASLLMPWVKLLTFY